MDDPTNPRDRAGDAPTDDRARALSPLPPEQRQAPPVDLDEREGHHAEDQAIPLPDHGEPTGNVGDELDDQIDDTLPPPTGQPTPPPEPGPLDDLDDQIDETLPAPEPREGETTDADDLDAETAYRLERDEPGAAGATPADTSPETPDTTDVLTALSMDASEAELTEEDTTPVNDESVTFTATGGSVPHAERESVEEPLIADGTTTCPTCGRQTNALRFCGYCGASLTEQAHAPTAETAVGRLQERAGMLLDPVTGWTRQPFVRLVLGTGAVLVLLALLANSGGLALMLGAAILPVILVYAFMKLDVFEAEPPLLIAGLGLAGALIGAVLGWLGAWTVTSNWFETGVLNYGAAGFGGRFAEAADNAPFSVWALNGLLLPLIAIAAIIGIPIAMRQSMSLRNEIMDGLTLAGAVAAGVSLGGAMVFAAPMLTGGGPASDAQTWTLTTIGLTILRPVIWTLGGAMLGAAAWRYLRTQRIGGIVIPVAGAVGGLLLYSFVAIQLASTGLWPEILWGVVMAAAVAVLYRMTLRGAIEEDRRALGSDNARIVCPNCHRVTPRGAFCAHCGASLAGVET
jgi:ribosomal protein L32